jgi:large subunit ribosomal protein L19e
LIEHVSTLSLVDPHLSTADRWKQVHKKKAEKARERLIKEEMDAKRAKTKAARERRQARIQSKRNALLAGTEDEAEK